MRALVIQEQEHEQFSCSSRLKAFNRLPLVDGLKSTEEFEIYLRILQFISLIDSEAAPKKSATEFHRAL